MKSSHTAHPIIGFDLITDWYDKLLVFEQDRLTQGGKVAAHERKSTKLSLRAKPPASLPNLGGKKVKCIGGGRGHVEICEVSTGENENTIIL
jgi:hypothetical protein